MDKNKILAALRAERDRIELAIAALQPLDGTGSLVARTGAAIPRQHPRRRRMSAAVRARLSAMMKARWAQRKKAAGGRHISVAARKRISEAAKSRWAAWKKAKAERARRT